MYQSSHSCMSEHPNTGGGTSLLLRALSSELNLSACCVSVCTSIPGSSQWLGWSQAKNRASFVGRTRMTGIPSGSCPYERAEVSRPTAPHLPASQGPARRSLSSPPQRPLFIPAKTKPKVYSSHPKHPKHPDIHQRYHFRLLWACALVYRPLASRLRSFHVPVLSVSVWFTVAQGQSSDTEWTVVCSTVELV